MKQNLHNSTASAFYRFKLQLLTVVFFLLSFTSFAQDSSHIRVSLLTCTPGDELYSTFGHSALRVTDSSSVSDIVFNYGTFNFDDPGFYIKFIRGKLLYYVSTADFPDFKEEYQTTNRGMTEQVLNLSAAEKIALMHFVYNNAKEQNRYYQYDFFLDNCTTRLRDIIVQFKTNYPPLKPVMPAKTRFRQAIHEYLDKGSKYWSKLGIDLLLGAPTDAVMTTAQSQFLPDNLMKALDSTNPQHQLVVSESKLYPFTPADNGHSFFTPMVVFSILLVFIIALSFSGNKKIILFLNGFDGLLLFLTGALGILFVFMWTSTDHSMVKNNFNLLWAWPTNIVFAFFVNSKKNWVKKYLGLLTIGLILVLLSWFFLPQQMNNALLPVILMMLYSSYRRYQLF
ncbi:DUF4105 domain-containing protein [Ferruginibacter paludis]|uniref:Lnb N-terminal periplasmic domain-containing protein n=1 Tax=Ferruginibacter paludis TaxID=1310417 RepID=UPI0025B5AE65|nr:DUF4105 domain-containing protein [Ferruginibacter paludis]MDN3658720.1 DUF4105 domain-containing protein [Ferruginibacter paludis]